MMKHLILLILLVACGKAPEKHSLPVKFVSGQEVSTVEVSTEAESSYKTILRTQEEALNSMTDGPGAFQMKEMVTDIAVAKSGILGLSALKANSGVEIKWARKSLSDLTPHEKSDYVIEEETSINEATDAITNLAAATGKIKITPHLRSKIEKSLLQIQKIIDETGSSSLGHWQFKGIRFDLNFSINGEVYFFAKAGVNLRLRMEWNYSRKPAKSIAATSRFVANTLAALNEVNNEITLPGFKTKQLSLGIGTTYKGQIGIWKYSPGFVGWLLFVPKFTKELSLPAMVVKEDFLIVGFEEKSAPQTISHSKVVAGLRQSLKTAAFFAESAGPARGNWFVSEIKTINDISYTGLFGLSDFTSKGIMEIDFKRNK